MEEIMTIGVTNYKGGVGKSTIAIYLAKAFSELNKKVLVVDDDQNLSAVKWAKHANMLNKPFNFDVATTRASQSKASGKNVIIYDTPARQSTDDLEDLVEISKIILIPTRAEYMSLEPTIELYRAIEKMSENVFLIFNDALPNGNFARVIESKEYLEAQRIKYIDEIIPRSAKFVDARNDGRIAGEKGGENFIDIVFKKIAFKIINLIGGKK